MDEQRVREIVRDEVGAIYEEYKAAHSFDGFLDYLEDNHPELYRPRFRDEATRDKRVGEPS